MMRLLVFYCPRSLRLFTVQQGPVYAGRWAVIELYGRQYQNITGIMLVTPATGSSQLRFERHLSVHKLFHNMWGV